MPTAWTITALQRVKAALVADASLSVYVDTVTLALRLRDDGAPDFTRHCIELAPGDCLLAGHSAETNKETFGIVARLWIRTWTGDEETLLTATDTSGGVGSNGSGGSQVGLLQFAEDLAGALRMNDLDSGGVPLVETTSLEAGSFGSIAYRNDGERDRAFVTHDMPITLQYLRDFNP